MGTILLTRRGTNGLFRKVDLQPQLYLLPSPPRNFPLLLLWSEVTFPSLLSALSADLISFCWFPLSCLFLPHSVLSIFHFSVGSSPEPSNIPWPSNCCLGPTPLFFPFHFQNSWKVCLVQAHSAYSPLKLSSTHFKVDSTTSHTSSSPHLKDQVVSKVQNPVESFHFHLVWQLHLS